MSRAIWRKFSAPPSGSICCSIYRCSSGVLITAADTLLILWFSRLGIRVIEAFVLVLIATIGGCFAFEIFLAQPHAAEVLTGLLPRLN